MPNRRTPEEIEFAARIKVARSLVRLRHSLEADRELNGLLADITEDHQHELQSGGLKRLPDGYLSGIIKDVADVED
jgi:hypothetical protein